MNPFGPGRSSPRSFAAIFKISTSVSSCRIRFFAFDSSAVSGVVIPCRSPRSIWSWRTQLCSAPALTPSCTAAVVMGFPARTSATARRRNSAGNGRGMDEASQRRPNPHTVAGNQTIGQVKVSTKPTAVPTGQGRHRQRTVTQHGRGVRSASKICSRPESDHPIGLRTHQQSRDNCATHFGRLSSLKSRLR